MLLGLGLFAAESAIAAIALITAAYGLVSSANAVLYLYTPQIYPTRMRARSTGAATCWLRVSSAAGQVLVGYLVAAGGARPVFVAFAVVAGAGVLAALRMLETSTRRLETIAA